MFCNKTSFVDYLLILSICFVFSDGAFEVNLGSEINVETTQMLRLNDVGIQDYLLNTSADGKCDCGPNSISCKMVNLIKTCICNTGYAPGQYGNCVETCNANNTCKNGGSCLQHVCVCLPGTSGPFCETIDECVDPLSPLCDPKAKDTSCQYDVETQRAFCYCHIVEGRYDAATSKCKVCECNLTFRKDYDAWYDCQWGNNGEKMCFCTEGHAYNPSQEICSDCVCGKHSKWCEFKQDGLKVCVCEDGYKTSPIDGECHKCDCGEHGLCTFGKTLSYGLKKCICDPGYTEINGSCVECDCGKHGQCVYNLDGRRFCDCEHDYLEKNGICEFCFCGDGSACGFNGDKKVCYCKKGYEEIHGFCFDIDECKHNPCGTSRDCINTLGSYTCKCKKGYQPKVEETVLEICEDINECQDSKACPDPNTECLNTPGSYKCMCKTGFASRGDVDSVTYCEKTAEWPIYAVVLITAIVALFISIAAAFWAKRNSLESLTRKPGRYELH